MLVEMSKIQLQEHSCYSTHTHNITSDGVVSSRDPLDSAIGGGEGLRRRERDWRIAECTYLVRRGPNSVQGVGMQFGALINRTNLITAKIEVECSRHLVFQSSLHVRKSPATTLQSGQEKFFANYHDCFYINHAW